MFKRSKDFKNAVKWMKKYCPLVWPVYIRMKKVPKKHDAWALSEFIKDSKSGPHFKITIDIRADRGLMFQLLIHEYAHCYAWTGDKTGVMADHSPLWGVAYSMCYLAAIGELCSSTDDKSV